MRLAGSKILWAIVHLERRTLLHFVAFNGNDGFYNSDVSATPADVKFSPKKKFEEKVFTVGPKGLSRALIRKFCFAINAQFIGMNVFDGGSSLTSIRIMRKANKSFGPIRRSSESKKEETILTV